MVDPFKVEGIGAEYEPTEPGSSESDSVDPDLIISSEAEDDPSIELIGLPKVLDEMGRTYRANPQSAVRDQSFIKLLHKYVGPQIESRLTRFATRTRKIEVKYEAKILGSIKTKDVDIAVIDPDNGPLVIIGVRSQMSSVGKNVLTYYEGVVGECMSLQERYPMATHGYIYLHPLKPIKEGKEDEPIDHARYAKMYNAVTGRTGLDYKNIRGVFDEFSYMVVDFDKDPPELRDDIVTNAVRGDLSIDTFVDRIIEKTKERLLFWDIFD